MAVMRLSKEKQKIMLVASAQAQDQILKVPESEKLREIKHFRSVWDVAEDSLWVWLIHSFLSAHMPCSVLFCRGF